MFTGQSMWPEVTYKHPCRAAVGCVLMESSTYLEVITPGETQTGYSLCVTSNKFLNISCYFQTIASCARLCGRSASCLQTSFRAPVFCTLQIYRLPLRAPSLVWEEMRDLKGLPPSCKDKLGCWVQKNRWGILVFSYFRSLVFTHCVWESGSMLIYFSKLFFINKLATRSQVGNK